MPLPFTSVMALGSVSLEWKDDTYCSFDIEISLMLLYINMVLLTDSAIQFKGTA